MLLNLVKKHHEETGIVVEQNIRTELTSQKLTRAC